MTTWLEAMRIKSTPKSAMPSLTGKELRILEALVRGPKSMRELHGATSRRLRGFELRASLVALSGVGLAACTRTPTGPKGGRPRDIWRVPPDAYETAREAVRPRELNRDAPRHTTTTRRQRATRPVPVAMSQRLLEWISEGRYLRDFCRQPGTPARRTVYDWLRKDAAFRRSFENARSFGEMMIEDELMMLVDSPALHASGLGGARGFRQFQRRVIGPYLQRLQRWRHHSRRRRRVVVVTNL